MPRHHYLPATFLANFSLDTETYPRRKRKIFIGDKETKEVYPTTAEKAGAIKNLYTSFDIKADPEYIEHLWEKYESDLHIAIPRLIVGDIDGITWLRLLVPFVSCMLVRGPDFDIRFSNRIRSLLGETKCQDFIKRGNINGARIIELQRLLFPVTAANWIVIYCKGKEPLITNDLGFSPFIHPRFFDYGMALPLGSQYTLAISPRTNGEILRYHVGKWKPIIRYVENQYDTNEDLNQSITSMAQRFIFAPTYELAEKYINQSTDRSRPIEPDQLGFIDGYHLRAYEFTWHRLVIYLEEHPTNDEEETDFPLNWKFLLDGWNPPVIIPLNLTGFPPPIQKGGSSISFNFYNPDDYYLLNRILDFERMGLFDDVVNEANIGFQNSNNEELKIEFLFSLSIGFYELGYRKESSKILDFILETNPNFHRARLNRAANFLQERKLDKAFIDLEYILSIEPNSVEALINLSNCYVFNEDYTEAIKTACKACSSAPEGNILGLALTSRGFAFLSDNQFMNAFSDFSQALQYIEDEEKKGFCNLYKAFSGIQILKNKENKKTNQLIIKKQANEPQINQIEYSEDEAIIDLTKSIDLLENKPELLTNALNLRGDLYHNKGAVELALNDYSAAAGLTKTDPEYFFKQGELLIKAGKLEESIQMNDAVINLSPKIGGAYNNRGIAKMLLDHLQEAETDFKKSLEVFGESVESGSPNRHLAHLAIWHNDCIKAKEYIQRSQYIDPACPYNIIINMLVNIHCEDENGEFSLFTKLLSQHESIPDYLIYEIFPLLKTNQVNKAQTIFVENQSKITFYTKKIVQKHLLANIEKKPEQQSWTTFNKLIMKYFQ